AQASETIVWFGDKLGCLGNFGQLAAKGFGFVLVGFWVGVSIFVHPTIGLDRGKHAVPNNLYSFICEEIVTRFRSFYESFAQVMGAQILISFLNTCFTAAYVLIVGLPYAALVIALTFVCGLLPVVGNL